LTGEISHTQQLAGIGKFTTS